MSSLVFLPAALCWWALKIIITIIIIIITAMFMVLSSWPVNARVHPTELGCESAENRLLPYTSTIALIIILLSVS